MAVGKAQEALELVIVEKVAVDLQLVGNALDLVLDLREFEGISVDDVAGDILLEDSDDFEGLLVHSDGADEELIAVALLVEEDFDLAGNLVLTSFVPGKVILGVLELLLEAGSVFNGLLEELLVEAHDFGELLNGPRFVAGL